MLKVPGSSTFTKMSLQNASGKVVKHFDTSS